MEKKEIDTHIKITVKRNFRKFKEGEVIEFDIQRYGITYITGKNGQGKTTILRAFRNIKDSLKDVNKEIFDGMTSSQLENDRLDTKTGFEIEGFDYDEVFCLDSVIDDPLSFENSATAWGLCSGGGLGMMRMSKGEKAIMLFHTFIQKIEQFFNNNKSDILVSDKKILVIIDEVDEGFDASLQMNYNNIIFNKLILGFACDVLVVTHNTLCMLSPSRIREPFIYDLETKTESTPIDYFKRKTGYDLTITKLESEKK